MLPEKWYVLYSNREEFETLKTHFKKNWTYKFQENPPRFGYVNISDLNNWVGESDTIKNLKQNDFIEITFQEFEQYILNKSVVNEDMSYLEKLLKRWNIR